MTLGAFDPFRGVIVVERVLSELDSGCIFAGRSSDGRSLRVKFAGKGAQPSPGEAYEVVGLRGSYTDRYGRAVEQIDSRQLRRVVSTGALLGPWLEKLPNILATRSDRLVAAFGADLPTVLSDFSRVDEVARVLEPSKPRLAIRIAQQVYAAMAAKSGADATAAAEVEFLAYLESLHVVDVYIARRLWNLIGGLDAKSRLQRNPYLLASLTTWKKADYVGMRLLKKLEAGNKALDSHPARLLGALDNCWRDILAEGDTAATSERLEGMLHARNVDPLQALRLALELHAIGRIDDLYRAPGAAWLEDSVRKRLHDLEDMPPSLSTPSGDEAHRTVFDAETKTGQHLTDEQHDAVARLLTLPLGVLQGGAGVGKTTVMKVLCTAWEFLDGNVVMCALAGKAALQLSRGASSASTPRIAYTIARLTRILDRHVIAERSNGLPADVEVYVDDKTLLIIDEASMLDTPSLHLILSHLPLGARLVLVGDHGQLPPVGIGNVFHDLVEEGTRTATLTKIHRQAADSAIPVAAAQVRSGNTPKLDRWSGQSKGIFFAPKKDLQIIHRKLLSLGEVIAVAALRDTVAAINDDESYFRRTRDARTVRLGPQATVAVGDPVVATKNRYRDGLFNGTLGVVFAIDSDDRVQVLWEGETEARLLEKEAGLDVELAYAITCHRAQGSSARNVVVVLEDCALSTREWLYTAITRARELVILVGDEALLGSTVSRRTQRVTGFRM